MNNGDVAMQRGEMDRRQEERLITAGAATQRLCENRQGANRGMALACSTRSESTVIWGDSLVLSKQMH